MQMTNSENQQTVGALHTHTHTHLFLTNSFFKENPFHSGNGCNRGISLIALIITIIVIIILAAISIAGVSGVVERSRYAKFCGDLDAVQDAISQAYGNQLVAQSLQNPTNRKSSEEVYEELAGGTLLDDCVEIVDGKNLGIDLPKYGDSKWYVDVSTGEVFLSPGFEYEDKIYANKTDIQNGGAEKPIDYTGYYADVDGNGEIDGIIFADLAVGKNGEWKTIDGVKKFTIPAKPIGNLKEYKISENTASDDFGEKFVVSPINPAENTGKKDRFYVMALDDITGGYSWYYAPYHWASSGVYAGDGIIDWGKITSSAFGSGKMNTITMIEKWNNEVYGAKKDSDMWKAVQEAIKQKKAASLGEWFVPSKEEWSAFGFSLKIEIGNYESYGLSSSAYWSSSLVDKTRAWNAHFSVGAIKHNTLGDPNHPVRLATTF